MVGVPTPIYMKEYLLLTHVFATWFMTGVIWVVQLMQYPSFQHFREAEFAAGHDRYRVRMAFLATFPMVVEAVTAICLLIYPPVGVTGLELWTGLTLVAVIWISTFALQVPLHERLSGGHDFDAVGRLVSTNWIRTSAWSARSLLVAWWMLKAL